MKTNHGREQLIELQREYRKELEHFYAWLKLAPPYHSVEKAIQCLKQTFELESELRKQEVLETPQLKWSLFQKAFIESGLVKKHRGIISGLAAHQNLEVLPEPHQYFIKAFL